MHVTQEVKPFVTLRADEDNSETQKVPWTPSGIMWKPDQKGIHWAPYGGSMEGDAIFAKVHPIRQKMCMEYPLCQVCGSELDAKHIPWLLNGESDPQIGSDTIDQRRAFTTLTPPTCLSCQKLAAALCPHLRQKPTARLVVRKYSVVGVYGDYFPPEDDDSPYQNIVLRFATLGSEKALRYFVAKQSVAEIRQYRIAK
jgi:hypothetical protein